MFPTGRKSISSEFVAKIVWKSYETGISKKKLSAKERAAGRIGNDFYITAISARNVKSQCTWWFIRKIKSFISIRTRAGLFLQGHIPVWTVIAFIRQSPTNC